MKDKISVIIPVKNKSDNRLNIVCSYLKNELIKEIIIVDYNSNKPVKVDKDKVKIIRYNKNTPWNKAHAINIGAKKAKGEYLMTLDADIILPSWFFNSDKLLQELKSNNFIYSKYVKRIKKEDISNDYERMLKKSWDWGEENHNYHYKINHTGTGGVQIFPREWFLSIRGVDENLVYYGGMDNITLSDAIDTGLNLISLNSIIFHIEHEDRKENNLPEGERGLAFFIRKDRSNLLSVMDDSNEENNPGFFGRLSGPNCPILKMYKQKYKEYLKQNQNIDTIIIDKPAETSILVIPITNKESIPKYFSQDLNDLLYFTKKYLVNTYCMYINACDVNHMRNLAIDLALKNGFDYLVMLDDDHNYPKDFILRLLAHNKPFVTGLTLNRVAPLHYTQYYKINENEKINFEKNYVRPNGRLQRIEASGPVGMLMEVNKLRYLPRPWFKMTYKGEDNNPFDRGGDFYFCEKLKKFGYNIWVDTKMEFPHHATAEIKGNGVKLPLSNELESSEKKKKKEYVFLPKWD